MSLEKMKKADLIAMIEALQADNLAQAQRIEELALAQAPKLQPRQGGNANAKFSAKQSTEWMTAAKAAGWNWRDNPVNALLGVSNLNKFDGTFEDALARITPRQ